MDKNSGYRTNVIGAGEVGVAISVDMDTNTIHETNSLFWDTKGNEVLGATALPLYGAFVSEEQCQLLVMSQEKVAGDRLWKRSIFAISGERNASELWGTDIAENQIEKTRQLLTEHGLSAKLICSPMEEECGLPEDYFDFVYSVYAIGWTTDLEGTFSRIASYLKKDGSFIFSWSHPIHKCVVAENDMLVFKNVISMNLGIQYLLMKVR